MGKIKEFVNNTLDYAAAAAGACVLSLAVNAPIILGQAGIEYLQNAPKQEQTLRLKKKDNVTTLNTKASYSYGDFETSDGSTVRIYDFPRVLEGKIFPNMVIDNLEVGKTYRVSSIGDDRFGHTILNARGAE